MERRGGGGGGLRTMADYTVGLVIVTVHFVVIAVQERRAAERERRRFIDCPRAATAE